MLTVPLTLESAAGLATVVLVEPLAVLVAVVLSSSPHATNRAVAATAATSNMTNLGSETAERIRRKNLISLPPFLSRMLAREPQRCVNQR